MGAHTFILYTHANTCGANSPARPLKLGFSQQVGWPLNLTSHLLLLFMNLFLSSAELSEPKVPPCPLTPSLPPSHICSPPTLSSSPTFTPCQRRRANSVILTRSKKKKKKKKKEEEANTERDENNQRIQMSHCFLLLLLQLLLRLFGVVSSCLACKSFSCIAGQPLLAGLQLSTLLSPRQREEEERTNIVTARPCCKAAEPDARCTHFKKRKVGYPAVVAFSQTWFCEVQFEKDVMFVWLRLAVVAARDNSVLMSAPRSHRDTHRLIFPGVDNESSSFTMTFSHVFIYCHFLKKRLFSVIFFKTYLN